MLGFIAGASVVRRDSFFEAGGFHPRFGVGGEEQLLAIDLVDRGWTLVYAEDIVAYHHPSSRRDPDARSKILVRNDLWIIWLRRPVLTAARRTWRCARQALRDSRIAGGLAAAAWGLPWIIRERKEAGTRVQVCLELLEGG